MLKKIIATFLYYGFIISVAKWFRNVILQNRSLTVLCYHRIDEKKELIAPQCIPPEAFKQQVSYLSKDFDCISPYDIEAFFDNASTLARDAVVFTFDDGYKDNLEQAAPILNERGIRACFFISSHPILTGEAYWVDKISSILSQINHVAQVEKCANESIRSQLKLFAQLQGREREQYAVVLFKSIKALTNEEVVSFINTFSEEFNNDATPSLMSLQQTKQLAVQHDVGGHTRNHPRLSSLAPEVCLQQIANGIQDFSEESVSIRYFAYPFGKHEDLPLNKPDVFKLFEEKGIKLAFTTIDGAVCKNDHRFLVPRKVMSNQTIPQIALKLEMMAWKAMLK